MTRSYEVKYRDILNREMTLYFHIDDTPSMLDRQRLKKLIPERFKGLIDYPCTIPWQCYMTHDGCHRAGRSDVLSHGRIRAVRTDHDLSPQRSPTRTV